MLGNYTKPYMIFGNYVKSVAGHKHHNANVPDVTKYPNKPNKLS